MQRAHLIGAVVALGAWAALVLPATADVIVGLPPNTGVGNCFPWGCAYNGEYQQVYANTAFSGPITITALEFYNTVYQHGSTQLPYGNYVVSLSTTVAGLTTLSPNYSANEGPDETTVFTGNINQPWTFGDTLKIVLSTPFHYDPSHGNLLMDVVASGVTIPGGNTYFDDHFNGPFSRAYCIGVPCSLDLVDQNYGIVTGFVTRSTPVPAPEPLTLTLFAAGLAGFGALRRRKHARGSA